MEKCKQCGKPTADKTDLFCPNHAVKTLRQQLDAGYLEPLSYWTIDGPVILSEQPFLTISEGIQPTPEASELNCSDC